MCSMDALLHALLLLLARLFLVDVFGVYIVKLISAFHHAPVPPSITSTSNLPECGNDHGLQVIACGFPRCGTLSLKLALQHIGFDPCYHGSNLVLSAGHADLWLKAARGKLDDWSLILGGYKAIVDFPAPCFYKELMVAYPKAKVILNIRDPEKWYESFSKTLYKVHSNLVVQMFRPNSWRCSEVLLYQEKFKGRTGDKEFMIGVYKQHIEEVKRVVSKDKLLVYNVQDGWVPLCNFLEVNLSQDIPFPRVNDSSTIGQAIDKYFMVFRLALAIYVVLISVLVVVVLKCISYIIY